MLSLEGEGVSQGCQKKYKEKILFLGMVSHQGVAGV